MLRDVFAECVRVLEPGGRIVVNVANLGRKPYRSLAGDVTTILQDELAMLLRGEIVWVKAKGAAGLVRVRLVHEGVEPGAARPHRAGGRSRRRVASTARLPVEAARGARACRTSRRSARRSSSRRPSTCGRSGPSARGACNHPAPFPVELPERFIRLYTYVGDVVLDPFLGSGSTAVAAARNGRHYVGYDTDPEYVAIAEARIAEARADGRLTPTSAGARPTDGRRGVGPYHPAVASLHAVLGVSVTSNLYLLTAFGGGRDLVPVALRAARSCPAT